MVRNYVKTGRKSGQPTKLTPECFQVILEALQKHNYVSTACDLAGISEATFYNWLDRAEKYKARLIVGESIEEEGRRYLTFFDAVKQARAGSEGELLGRIDTAGSVATLIEKRTIEHTLKDKTTKTETIERWKPPDWTANAWILERTRWEKYGQHSSLDIQQAGVIFIERLQRARSARVADGEFREIEDIAKEPTVEEVPAESLMIVAPRPASTTTGTQGGPGATPRRRPIFELIARTRESRKLTSDNNTLSEPGGNVGIVGIVGNQAQPEEREVIDEIEGERGGEKKSDGGEVSDR